MKSLYPILLLLLFTSTTYSQSETYTSQEVDENVNTTKNTTRINLFNIDFNGSKIPINLIYRHTGIKVNETPTAIGLGWDLENIGMIKRIVNGKPDRIGTWFSSPSYSSYTTSYIFDSCSDIPDYSGSDFSPDFFSCNSAAGLHCDFLFKKNYPNSPIPVLLTNDDGIKIAANFSKFLGKYDEENSDVVFNITDSKGVIYEFINGPVESDNNGYAENRNDFYLKSITNPNHTENLQIEYLRVAGQIEKNYKIGAVYLSTNNGYDYQHNISANAGNEQYIIDNNRLFVSKITTDRLYVEFHYNQFHYLTQIDIKELNGTYISGYTLEYDYSQQEHDLLWKIRKLNNNMREDSKLLYEFDYFYDNGYHYDTILNRYIFRDSSGHYEDFFGYSNGVFKDNLFPFAVRASNNYVEPAGDYFPNLMYAKQFSLSRITNIYGGTTDFDYQLNEDEGTGSTFRGPIYGGGIMIKSIETNPIIGKKKLKLFHYEGLDGYVIALERLDWSFIIGANFSKKFFSRIPILLYTSPETNYIPQLQDMHKQGNFFSKVSESTYDENNDWLESVTRTYEEDYTGIYKSPILVNETFYGSHHTQDKEINYTYDYSTLETIASARYRIERRSTCLSILENAPIPINRVRLINKKITYNYVAPLAMDYDYTYINTNSSLIRSVSETASNDTNLFTKFYYATDTEVSGTPHLSDLVSKNMIGIPILQQKYSGGEKIFEEKTVFGNDTSVNNQLLPKFIYSKKGSTNSVSLEKRISYTQYDSKGNIAEYTIEDGITTCLIWGYNQTQPVAKLENIHYSTIPISLINAIRDVGANDMENALNNLRTNSTILAAKPMITTYTYRPFNGISTVTDPKGYKTFYEYDDFNRLKYLKDADGKLLKEYDYNYEPQN